jgi:hypothetical protein
VEAAGDRKFLMAKDPDNLADNFESENTGGVLSGFLAEEDEFDRRALWRLGSWGVASVGAVIVAVLANQSSIGVRREQVAAAELAQQSQQIQSLAKQSQSEARRLASAIDTLNGDRDRLYTRVTVLEQGLDSVTGSIAKQASKPESAKADNSKPEASKVDAAKPDVAKADKPDNAKSDNTRPASPQAAAGSVPAAGATAELPAIPANAPQPPVVAPVTTTAAATADKPPAPAQTVAAGTEPAPATVASVTQGSTAPAAPSAAPPTPAAASPTPPNPASPMEWKSLIAPPDPAASKLIEADTPSNTPPKTVTSAPIPEVVASAPSDTEAEGDEIQAKPADVAVQRTEFGVDVGGANSVSGLRALWRGLLKSRSNAALTVLRPIIVVKENTGGLGMQLRLVAGPLADAAAAAKICATLAANQRPCETAIFDGQRLAMNAGDQPAPAKPAPARRHSMPRHVVANDDAAKKPEPSTFDRIFHRN